MKTLRASDWLQTNTKLYQVINSGRALSKFRLPRVDANPRVLERLLSTRWKENEDLGIKLGRAIMEHCLDVRRI